MSDAVNVSRCQVQVFSSDSYQAEVLAYLLLARENIFIFHVHFRFPRPHPFPAFPYTPSRLKLKVNHNHRRLILIQLYFCSVCDVKYGTD